MAYPRARSCNGELDQGMVDGAYKQVNRDRGGVIDPATYEARRDLCDTWFGIHEQEIKRLPDNMSAHTPTCTPTAPASCCC